MPIASIVIPTYNRQEGGYLRRAIDSALNQTLSDIEVIVVDGGSTDDTPALINNYSDDRLDYIRFEENEPVNKTRNVGIEHSEGDFISFLDSDDILTENHIERCVEILRNAPRNCAAVSTSYEHIDDEDIVGSTTMPNGTLSKDRIRLNNMGGFSCYTIRAAIFEEVGLLEESIPAAEDLAFCIKLSLKFDIVGTDEKLVKYSVRGEGRLEGDIEARLSGNEYVLKTYGDLLSDKQKAKLQFSGGLRWLTKDVNKARARFRNAILSNPRNLAYYYHYIPTFFGERVARSTINAKSVLFPAANEILNKASNIIPTQSE